MHEALCHIECQHVAFKRPVTFDELRILVRDWSRVAYLSETDRVYHVLDGCGRRPSSQTTTVFDAEAQRYTLCAHCDREAENPQDGAEQPSARESSSLKWLTSHLSSVACTVRQS